STSSGRSRTRIGSITLRILCGRGGRRGRRRRRCGLIGLIALIAAGVLTAVFLFFFRGGGRALAGRRRCARLLGVVGDVPARALELEGRRRDELRDWPLAARRADLQRGIREFPNHLETGAAGVTLVFVEGHLSSANRQQL